MTLNRRGLLAGATGIGAAGIGALAACSSPTQGDPLRSGQADLTLWTHDPGYATFFTDAAADAGLVGDSAWTYSVEVTSIAPPDIISRLINQAVAQRPLPSMAGLELGQFPRMMREGIAENLLVDLSPLTDPLGDGLLKTQPYTVDGGVYALESDNSVSVMYYRADEFERLGIPEDVATWEELLDIGAQVAADTGQAVGMVSDGDNTAIVQGYMQALFQRGGGLYDADGELIVLSEENVEVLELMAEGVRSGALLSLADPYGSATGAALKESRLIATVMPNWYKVYGLEANVPDQAGLWRARTIPRYAGGGGIASTLGGTAFGVVKDQVLTDAAVDFLQRCYLTPEGQLARYAAGAYLPTLADLYDTPEFQNLTDPYLGDQRIFEVYGAAVAEMPAFYQAADLAVLRDSLGGPVLRALKGEIGAEDALREGVDAYERQVSE
ncbi:ABC transporter substrate-binding protein [Glycomyces sp. A-F 0318]|uniref:ABC transporter substrate-binding protein n=1 Tax=Glycomyces amatae TaxID=2881355 RepID=UPI001E4A97F8|nr:ABC transporter substrate-binding protein [Glycomyces amatae]MCD0444160.1 ABC transporter substrate-binding protein [Glycomyces amatae]